VAYIVYYYLYNTYSANSVLSYVSFIKLTKRVSVYTFYIILIYITQYFALISCLCAINFLIMTAVLLLDILQVFKFNFSFLKGGNTVILFSPS